MAHLKGLVADFTKAYHRALADLKEKEPSLIFGLPKEEVFRRGAIIASDLQVYPELERATEILRRLIARNPSFKEGTTVVALRLTGAKGRLGRAWFAPPGGLWFSLALYDDFGPETRAWLPLLIGCALAEGVRFFGVPARVKWVNDLLVAGKKLAGVLTEQEVFRGERWSLVGIGLNVNNPLPPDLPAISLREILGHPLPLPEVFGRVAACLAKYYGIFRAAEVRYLAGESLPFKRIFSLFSDTPGRTVVFGQDLQQEAGEIAQVLEIDEKGRLVLQKEGMRFFFSGGEILYLD